MVDVLEDGRGEELGEAHPHLKASEEVRQEAFSFHSPRLLPSSGDGQFIASHYALDTGSHW